MRDGTMKPSSQMNSDRRRFLQVASVAAGGALLAACGGGGTTTATQLKEYPTSASLAPDAVKATVTASEGKTYFPSGDPNVPDAYTAPMPLTQSVRYIPGQGGKVTVFAIGFKPAPPPKENNAYLRELNKRMNIDWQVSFGLGNEGYTEKIGTLLASNDLPDLVLVVLQSAPALLRSIQQGAFTDLTEYLSGDALKDYPNLAKFSPQVWKNVAINGKIYGVPRPRPLAGGILNIRLDWAKKVGIPNPTSLDEFYELLKAFTKGDPDGNGRNDDSWGIGMLGSNYNSFFYNIYNVPNNWRLEKDGKLTYYLKTQEFKDSVAFMRKIYADGLCYPDMFAQTQLQVKNNIAAGKYGAYCDGFSGLSSLRLSAQQVNPDADIGMLVPFGVNGNKANSSLGPGFYAFTAISSKTGKDPERVKELLRILDYFAAPSFSVEREFLAYGLDGVHNEPIPGGGKKVTPNGTKEISDLATLSNPMPIYYSTREPEFALNQQKYTRSLVEIGIYDPTASLTSDTASRQDARLKALFDDRFARIIKGTDPLSAVNDMHDEWFKNGGEQITKEYMEALQKK